MTALIDIK